MFSIASSSEASETKRKVSENIAPSIQSTVNNGETSQSPDDTYRSDEK
jgi:hypothetical protein